MNQLFQTKSLDELVAETQEEGHQLKKVLGPVNLIALGIGAVIGAGIFATIGTAAAGDAHRPGAGPALMLSFVLTAVVCGFTALCYAEFASMVPVAGSAYTYSYATLGELVAWIIGWDLILEYAIGNVAVAISWANYCNTLLEGLRFKIFGLQVDGIRLPPWLTIDYRTAHQKMPAVVAGAPHVFGIPIVFNILAFAIVAFITVILVWGVRESARFNALMVGIKLVVLTFFAFVSFHFVKPANWHPFAPNGFSGIGTGAAIIFFAYIGFDAVSTTAEECRNPRRDMPIGIIGSLIVCTVIYVVIAAVFTGMVPFRVMQSLTSSQQAEPLTMAMKYVAMPNWMVGIVALGSVIAHTAVLLVFQLGQPRIFFAMARDGFLPPVFARVHPKFRTPHVTTILTGILVGTAAAVANIDEMVDLTNIGTLFAFILVCLGIIVLRYKDPSRPRPFRVASWTWLAALWPILIFSARAVIVHQNLSNPQISDYFHPWPIGGFHWINWIALALYVLALVLIPVTVAHRKVFAELLLPSLGLISCAFLIYYLPPSSWMRFFLWLLTGLVIYFSYGFWHSRLRTGRRPSGPADFNPSSDLPPQARG